MRLIGLVAALQVLLVATPDAPAPLPNNAGSGRQNPLEYFRSNHATLRIESNVSVRTNITSIKRSGEWISVSWSGVQFPTYDDLIAVYPAHAEVKSTAPIKFKMAASSPSHILLGSGSTSFRLLNHRVPLSFAFLRGGLDFPQIVAWSEPVTVEHVNEPTQGHLSLTGRSKEVAVQWATKDKGVRSQVEWGWATGQYSMKADAMSRTYARSDMCGPPANTTGWLDPGWLHYAVMKNLQPGKRVYYRYGGSYADNLLEEPSRQEEWSQEYSFVGPPAVGRESVVRILAVADLGQAEIDGALEMSEMQASRDTTARLATEVSATENDSLPYLFVHNGDISYARGYSSQWDVYWDQLAAVVRSVPYMTSPGNHERDWPDTGDRFGGYKDSGGECGVAYNLQTGMSSSFDSFEVGRKVKYNTAKHKKRLTADAPWYSFDFGPIHFLQYSTEHAFDPGSSQYSFIEEDLATVNRNRTPWLIVGGHRPIYLDSIPWSPLVTDGDQIVAAQLRGALEPLLLKYGVDATWHGHHHSYQRTCPVAQGRCARKGGVVHLVIGHAGAVLSPNIHFRKPAIFENVQLRHGYMVVEANATHMTHRMVSSANGAVMDEFTLVKDSPVNEWGRAAMF